jgi:5'-3' exonuclease
VSQELPLFLIQASGQTAEPGTTVGQPLGGGQSADRLSSEGQADGRIEAVVVVTGVLDVAEELSYLDVQAELAARHSFDRVHDGFGEEHRAAGDVPCPYPGRDVAQRQEHATAGLGDDDLNAEARDTLEDGVELGLGKPPGRMDGFRHRTSPTTCSRVRSPPPIRARQNGGTVACDWLFIDGSSLIFRAYFGWRGSGPGPEGMQVNAIRGFLERLARLVVEREPRRLAVADDWAWRPDWRVDLISTYKSHRVAKPVPDGLAPQIPVIRDLLQAIGVDMVGVAEHEAEDVIATWSGLVSGTVEIASGDRDLFALVEDPRVRVLYPEKSGLAVIDESEVTRRYGIPGRRYADFAILRGDPSDGLPGLQGVGSVTAAGMIRRYGDVAGVLRDRALRDADRKYLENAIRVVPPVADLAIAVPPGRRHGYPENETVVESLATQYGVRESCARLLAALDTLAVVAEHE